MTEVSPKTKEYVSSVLDRVALDENGNRRRGLKVGSDNTGSYCIDFGHGITYRQQPYNGSTLPEAILTYVVEGGVRREWNLRGPDSNPHDGSDDSTNSAEVNISRRDYGGKGGNEVVGKDVDYINSNPDAAYRALARLLERVCEVCYNPEILPSVELDPYADFAHVE